MKIVVDIDKLRNGTIIDIANDLGCEIKYPKMDIALFQEDESEEDFKKRLNEANEKNDIIFDNYMNNLLDWLENNDYLRDYGEIEILDRDLYLNDIIIKSGDKVFQVKLNNIFYEGDSQDMKVHGIECTYLETYDKWIKELQEENI